MGIIMNENLKSRESNGCTKKEYQKNSFKIILKY